MLLVIYRIVQDHQLDLQIICTGLGKKLAEDLRISDIKSLVDCLKTSGVVDVNSIVDEMISTGIPVLVENGAPLPDLEPLPKLIKNINLRVGKNLIMLGCEKNIYE